MGSVQKYVTSNFQNGKSELDSVSIEIGEQSVKVVKQIDPRFRTNSDDFRELLYDVLARFLSDLGPFLPKNLDFNEISSK